MERATARLRRPKKEDKKDGSFKFTVSLIIFVLTVLYRLYDYVSNGPIPLNISYVFFSFLIINVITLLSMSIYIFTKAMSLGVKDFKTTEKLENCANNYYLTGWVFGYINFITLSIFCLAMVIENSTLSLLGVSNNRIQSVIITALIFFIGGLFIRAVLERSDIILGISLTFLKDTIKVITPLFFVSILISLQLFNGNTIIEMNDMYSKQSEQIPIVISITGVQYDNVVVNLSKVELNNNLKLIDSIKIKSTHDKSKVISSEYLIGNNLNVGKFKFYINSTNLSAGYYELSATTGRESLKSSLMKTKTTSFYLIDKE